MFCQNGDIRLVNGTNRYEGRVEFCYDEVWGTICDGLWSTNDANVACRQLGFADNGMIKQEDSCKDDHDHHQFCHHVNFLTSAANM